MSLDQKIHTFLQTLSLTPQMEKGLEEGLKSLHRDRKIKIIGSFTQYGIYIEIEGPFPAQFIEQANLGNKIPVPHGWRKLPWEYKAAWAGTSYLERCIAMAFLKTTYLDDPIDIMELVKAGHMPVEFWKDEDDPTNYRAPDPVESFDEDEW